MAEVGWMRVVRQWQSKMARERLERADDRWEKKRFNYQTCEIHHGDEQQTLFSRSRKHEAYAYVGCPVCEEKSYVIFHERTRYGGLGAHALRRLIVHTIGLLARLLGREAAYQWLSVLTTRKVTARKVANLEGYGYQVVQCIKCGMLYRNPTYLPRALDEAYNFGGYSKFLGGAYSSQRVRRYEQCLKRVGFFEKTEGFSRKRVLDLGCGYGLFLNYIRGIGWETYGLDFAEDSILAGRKEFGLSSLAVGNLERDSFEPEFFDVVCLWSVVAHLDDPVEMFRRIWRVLGVGGYLVIYTVNAESWGHKLNLEYWGGFSKNHLVFFSPGTLGSALAKAGFSEVQWGVDEGALSGSRWGKRIRGKDLDAVRAMAEAGNAGEMQCVLARK